MRLFYDSNITSDARTHQLSEMESKHIVRVLRMNVGDQLALVNGSGGYFEGTIADAHAKRCSISIDKSEQSEPQKARIHIALGPTKQIDRIEWFIEKATEIGVTDISFVSGKNSERIKLNPDRLEKKAISAMKQSKRLFLPIMHDVQTVSEFIKTHPNGLIAHCYEGEKYTIQEAFRISNDPDGCPILIGPEGDFTHDEIKLALENGYKTVTLGENRLRTETAALYACMAAQLKIDALV